jgi:uracil-DNA glycosylase
VKKKTAEPYLPKKLSLKNLKTAAQDCRGCPLYKNATQAVVGEGAQRAQILFVGEQPGDREDLAGLPFVGPAGNLLDKALEQARISRAEIFVTNAVKHFKWKPQGKRRIHQRPNAGEMQACRPWLEAEMKLVRPLIVVCMGASAVYAVFGRSGKIKDLRSRFWETSFSKNTFVTVHPSALLRLRESEEREREFQIFVEDLKKVKERLKSLE